VRPTGADRSLPAAIEHCPAGTKRRRLRIAGAADGSGTDVITDNITGISAALSSPRS